jgi:DICT domain-containing protein
VKRALIAIAAAGIVVTAIRVLRASSGEDRPQAPSKTSAVDVSRDFDPEAVKEQAKLQADQVLKAREELQRKVAEQSRLLKESEGLHEPSGD